MWAEGTWTCFELWALPGLSSLVVSLRVLDHSMVIEQWTWHQVFSHWNDRSGMDGRVMLFSWQQENIYVIPEAMECTLHLSHATWSLVELLLSVVIVRKQNCLGKAPPALLASYPGGRQDGHWPGTSQNLCSDYDDDALIIAISSEENSMFSCIIFQC